MGIGEPALVPEWYRAGKGARTPNANSDDTGVGLSSRNRISLIPCDQDSRRASGRNSSVRSDKNSSSAARAYSNFGKRDRKTNLDSRDSDRHNLDIGSRDYRESSIGSRTETDRPWCSESSVSGRRSEFWENDSKGVVVPKESVTGGGVRRPSSFQKEFPILAAVQKKGALDTGGVFTAVHIVPLPSSTALPGDSWTSALAEVPSVVHTGPVSPVSLGKSSSNGLNMAEALIQASARVRTAPQLSGDTSRADELALRQCKQLIPMTPSMPKSSGLNSLGKSKVRGTSRTGDYGGAPRNTQQLSSQLAVNHSLPATARPDVTKASQIGNFQVLSRERTGVISPAKSKDVCSQDVSMKSSINLNIKFESKGTNMTLLSSKINVGSSGEKRPAALAQNRNDFFNSLRKKTSINRSSATSIPQPGYCDATEKSFPLAQNMGNHADLPFMHNQEESHGDGYCSDASMINLEETPGESGVSCGDSTDASYIEKPLDMMSPSESLEYDRENNQPLCCSGSNCLPTDDLDEREKAFLQGLGWKEDAIEEALTDGEIADFIERYQKLRPYCNKLGPYSKLSEHIVTAVCL